MKNERIMKRLVVCPECSKVYDWNANPNEDESCPYCAGIDLHPMRLTRDDGTLINIEDLYTIMTEATD